MSVDCVLGRLLYRPGSESMPRRVFSRVEGQIERRTDTCLIEVEHYPRRSGGEACGLLFKVCKVTNDVSVLPAHSASHRSPVSATDGTLRGPCFTLAELRALASTSTAGSRPL